MVCGVVRALLKQRGWGGVGRGGWGGMMCALLKGTEMHVKEMVWHVA